MSQYTKDKANDTQGERLTGADIQKEFGQHYLLPARPHGLFMDNFPFPPKQSQLTQEDLKNSKSKRSLKSQKI
ncbi:hypothetical protein QU579_00145 [Vibrio parahaemolyticus]|uniref:hypothetical protein n=1 Tax=Vibrio parahaemolyticus TaxID=670 RepID=UPI00317608C8